MTPEGKIKKKIKDYLSTLYPNAFFWMPVSSGFGNSAVDIICCYKGHFIAIEVKAVGKKATPRQLHFLNEVIEAGGYALETDNLGFVQQLIDEIDHARFER